MTPLTHLEMSCTMLTSHKMRTYALLNLSPGDMHQGQRAVISDLNKFRKKPTVIFSLAIPEKTQNISESVLLPVSQLCKNTTFWFNSKKQRGLH